MRSRALAFLHLGDHLTAERLILAVVELGVDAVTRKAAIASERGRLVDERAVDSGPHVSSSSSSARRLHRRGERACSRTTFTRGTAALTV